MTTAVPLTRISGRSAVSTRTRSVLGRPMSWPWWMVRSTGGATAPSSRR